MTLRIFVKFNHYQWGATIEMPALISGDAMQPADVASFYKEVDGRRSTTFTSRCVDQLWASVGFNVEHALRMWKKTISGNQVLLRHLLRDNAGLLYHGSKHADRQAGRQAGEWACVRAGR